MIITNWIGLSKIQSLDKVKFWEHTVPFFATVFELDRGVRLLSVQNPTLSPSGQSNAARGSVTGSRTCSLLNGEWARSVENVASQQWPTRMYRWWKSHKCQYVFGYKKNQEHVPLGMEETKYDNQIMINFHFPVELCVRSNEGMIILQQSALKHDCFPV